MDVTPSEPPSPSPSLTPSPAMLQRRALLRTGLAGTAGIVALSLPRAAAAASVIVPASESVAAGTVDDPILVTSFGDLVWIATDPARWGYSYRQLSHITVPAETTLDPIGTLATPFTGTYDGGGFTITGLQVATGSGVTAGVGLFGRASAATIERIVLDAASVSGQTRVGALVGFALSGTLISDCHVSGSATSVGTYVGGLIGTAHSGTIVTDCSSSVTVIAGDAGLTGTTNRAAGGLIGVTEAGTAQPTVRIERCHASGRVDGTRGVGGLIGWSRAGVAVEDCYARGQVVRSSGTDTEFASFLGSIDESSSISIRRSFATGKVTYTDATDPIDKGFVGGIRTTGTTEPVYADNYVNSDSSQQTSGTGATAITTTAMTLQQTFTGWDFDAVWRIDGSLNDGFPSLRSNPPR